MILFMICFSRAIHYCGNRALSLYDTEIGTRTINLKTISIILLTFKMLLQELLNTPSK